jgi:hypothetical protein
MWQGCGGNADADRLDIPGCDNANARATIQTVSKPVTYAEVSVNLSEEREPHRIGCAGGADPPQLGGRASWRAVPSAAAAEYPCQAGAPESARLGRESAINVEASTPLVLSRDHSRA